MTICKISIKMVGKKSFETYIPPQGKETIISKRLSTFLKHGNNAVPGFWNYFNISINVHHRILFFISIIVFCPSHFLLYQIAVLKMLPIFLSHIFVL